MGWWCGRNGGREEEEVMAVRKEGRVFIALGKIFD